MLLPSRDTEQLNIYSEEVDKQIKVRIKLSVCAYAYEFHNDSIISDGEFDDLSKQVNLNIDTRLPHMDSWFRDNFEPDTGMWIHKHPELDRVKRLYVKYFADRPKSGLQFI